MKNKLIFLFAGLLVLLNVGSFAYSMQSAKEVTRLNTVIASLPKDPIVYVGKDGHTPKLGIDYFLPKDGKDGVNSISFSNSVTETVVKELPLIGSPGLPGADGKDADQQQIRINPDNGNLETKMSSESFWGILVSCEELKVSCNAN